jgi:hypothetical protein
MGRLHLSDVWQALYLRAHQIHTCYNGIGVCVQNMFSILGALFKHYWRAYAII